MRIAFDVDETLIPYGDEFPTERSVPFGLLSFWYRERLRLGTTALLRELARDGHDVWIYTTSGRTSGYFRMWFLWLGIRLGGVINCHTHEQVIRAPGRSYPTAPSTRPHGTLTCLWITPTASLWKAVGTASTCLLLRPTI